MCVCLRGLNYSRLCVLVFYVCFKVPVNYWVEVFVFFACVSGGKRSSSRSDLLTRTSSCEMTQAGRTFIRRTHVQNSAYQSRVFPSRIMQAYGLISIICCSVPPVLVLGPEVSTHGSV